MNFKFKIFINSYQLLLLCEKAMIFFVQVDEYTHLGAQQIRINRFVAVIYSSGHVSLEYLFVAVIVCRNKNYRNVPKLFALIDESSCFKPVQVRHLHIHKYQRKVEFVKQYFQRLAA